MDYLFSSTRRSGTIDWRLLAGGTLLLLLSFGLGSCRGADWFLLKRTLHSKFNDMHWITTEELAARLAEKNRPRPVLLDVRTPAEYEVSHLEGARQVDPKADAPSAATRRSARCSTPRRALRSSASSRHQRPSSRPWLQPGW